MKVVVCVKHVPDGQGERRLEDGRIVRGEDDTLNELDEYAIEAAVSLVEEQGGEVIALTMGPADADEAILRALQMGADRGLHITDEQLAGLDAPGTAGVLAAAVRSLGDVDLVVAGMASLDGMTSLVPPALATYLGLPYLGLASQLELGNGQLEARRVVDGWEETLRAPLPAVVSVTDQVNEPRYPSFKALKAARAKPLDEVGWDDLAHFAPAGVRLASHSEVLEARPQERTGPHEIVEDTGDGGIRLAQFLRTHLN
ncbi:electron transfer flavoprotein subunit beta/FixA family protein [Scrofimicrobium sp. R131]|uniref:Electron transfer flavoprotein subunit beta n=1 Tax=Scrofimicrobium appendicitidis TaxID=3079930 RepID=A0AAU7V992_9ACTO